MGDWGRSDEKLPLTGVSSSSMAQQERPIGNLSLCVTKSVCDRRPRQTTSLISSGCLSPSTGATAQASVRIKVLGDHMFVSAIVNDVQPASILLDTGGARITLSPALLEHLRVSVPANVRRWTLDLPGGRPSRCHLPACNRGRDSIMMSSSAKNSTTLGVKLRGRG